MGATNHFGFTVADLDRAIRFYAELLGTEPYVRSVWEYEYVGQIVGYPGCRLDYAMFHLPGTDANLELLQYLDPPGSPVDMETNNPGISHLCLETDDIEADYERLRPLGATFLSAEPVEVPVGPYKGGKAAYARDSDGITIELIQMPRS